MFMGGMRLPGLTRCESVIQPPRSHDCSAAFPKLSSGDSTGESGPVRPARWLSVPRIVWHTTHGEFMKHLLSAREVDYSESAPVCAGSPTTC